MKKLLLIFLLILNINAQDINFPTNLLGMNDKPQSKLIGKVSSILTTSYRNGNLLGEITVENYDDKQRIIEKIRHHAGTEIHSGEMVNLSYKSYFEYEGMNKFPNIEKSYEFDGKKNTKVIYHYNAGRLEQELAYSNDEVVFVKINYSYIDEKQEVIIKSVWYYDKREVQSNYSLFYDKKQQWKKRIEYEKNGKIESEVSFEYDPNGLLKKVTNCCKFNFYHTYEYIFDNKGNWIERKELYSQKNKEGVWETSESLRTYRVITYLDE